MKTFDKKDVFTLVTAEEAKAYIGKQGYFNNDFEGMKRAIELGGPTVLGRVDTNSIWCFKALGVSLCFGLFLPANKVKEVEEPKKYRPFKTLEEFRKTLNNIDFSEPIQFRYKNNHNDVIMTIYTGYEELHNELIALCFGACTLVPENGFNDFEVYNDKTEEWQPFGVLDES